MMKDSWALRGRPQYILARMLIQKKNNNNNLIMNMKRKPKCDEYIVRPYLKQRG